MSTLTTEQVVGGTADSSGAACQTDPAPKSGNYELSRLNACKWQTRRETIMACMRSRCPYRFCGYSDAEMPPCGAACTWEVVYAGRLADQFDELFPAEGVGRYMDDRPHHRREWLIAHLLANRAAARSRMALQECFDAVTNRGNMPIERRPFQQHALAERYRVAARNRLEAVWAQLDVIERRLRDRRIITAMIEYGYYRPHDRDESPPNPKDAPDWILRMVGSN